MSAALIALGLLAALLALALYVQRRQFGKLRRWAAQSRLTDPPEAVGDWGAVFNLLHRHRRTNLKRRRQLAQLTVRSRRAAQALPYGVTVLDGELRLDWCNQAARLHFGLDVVRDRGAPILNFVRHPDFADYLEAGEFSEPLRLRAPGQAAPALSLQLVPFDEDAWLLLSQDVTAAERLEAMRRDFVANVSHELRTPLTVLTGFLETIRDLELEPQRVRDYVNLMAPQAARMRRIIEDLLALSALEHAPPPPEARVLLRPLLERLRTETEQLSAGRQRISLSIEGAHDLLGAESELASAFLNLASNAVRYTPAGGEIRLGWRSDAEGGEFSVADTGIGIESEHLPRLTERFYRVDRGRSRDSGGTGLGLAIVKHALARHQAALSIESTPGKGSTFRARFPAARLAPAPQKVPG
ncbi:MAG: phosphate regulon sensor histidine kinase PhoR [Betaproteobacteria bacterium]|nr:MAG: phosphate regulon sensor histidine kinase PhoR [Betaproteobacteria bacterium]